MGKITQQKNRLESTLGPSDSPNSQFLSLPADGSDTNRSKSQGLINTESEDVPAKVDNSFKNFEKFKEVKKEKPSLLSKTLIDKIGSKHEKYFPQSTKNIKKNYFLSNRFHPERYKYEEKPHSTSTR